MNRLARSLGIVAVFTFLGPIVVAVTLLLIALVIGVPVLLLLLLVFDFHTLWQWLALTMSVIAMFIIVGALLPAFITGIVFAVAAVYFHAKALRVALLTGAVAGIGIVVIGIFVTSSGSSSLLLPRVEAAGEALGVSILLAVAATVAAAMCWRVTRRLHGAPS